MSPDEELDTYTIAMCGIATVAAWLLALYRGEEVGALPGATWANAAEGLFAVQARDIAIVQRIDAQCDAGEVRH